MSDFGIEQAREAGQGFKEAMGMSDEEFEQHISFGFNRRLMERFEEMGGAKIIAEVTEAKYCLAGCQVGQKLVLQCVPAMLLPEESDCPLCSKAIGPVAELVHQTLGPHERGSRPQRRAGPVRQLPGPRHPLRRARQRALQGLRRERAASLR